MWHLALKGCRKDPDYRPHTNKSPESKGEELVESRRGQVADEEHKGQLGAAHADDEEDGTREFGL